MAGKDAGSGARRLAESEWSLAACVDGYEAIYERLVRGHPRADW